MSVEILQLSDLHLFADRSTRLKGVSTWDSLERVLRLVEQGEAAGRWKFDHIILSGDLTHDERRQTYVALREMLGDWLPRCRFLPGNHDDRHFLREVFPEHACDVGESLGFSLSAGSWRLIGLDSHLPGEVAGHVATEQLAWFRSQVEAHEGPVLAFMHHPPFPVRSTWIDALGLGNAHEVLSALSESGRVRAVSCGHVHQSFESHAAGVRLLTCPSTAIQFQPHREVLEVDSLPPGLRAFRLDTASWQTEVARLAELEYPPEPEPNPSGA